MAKSQIIGTDAQNSELYKPKHFMLIACAVLHRECYYCASISKNIIDVKLEQI